MAVQDIDLEDKYALVYNGTKLILGLLHTGQVSTSDANTIEVFDTLQEIVDRGLELGLEYTALQVAEAALGGATIPQEIIDWALAQDHDDHTAEYIAKAFP